MKDANLQKLIFIYNADSGLRNLIIDGAHKILSPNTYECKLCEITFGAFTENNIWKKFRTESDLKMEFLHKDEFKGQYALKFRYKLTFPVILSESANGLVVFVKTEELNSLKDAEELIALIKERVQN
ncbi:MAG: GTPase [Aurantibacter sp.]